jgi:hypothetical protein
MAALDWRTRGAVSALRSADPALLPLALRLLGDLHATSVFDEVVRAGREALSDGEARGALAYALGTLQLRAEVSLPLLFEILQLDDYRADSEACAAFERWRGAAGPEAIAIARRLPMPAGVDLQSWTSCFGLWEQRGVDAVLRPGVWSNLRATTLAAVIPAERPETARKLLAALSGAALPAERVRWIESLGHLGHGSRDVIAALDGAAEDARLREGAVAALARLLPTAPADALSEDRLTRWSREASRADVKAPFIARSPRLQQELVARIKQEVLPGCALLRPLLAPSGEVPAPIVAAIAARLASPDRDARDCASLLALDVVARAPSLVVPLAEVMRHPNNDDQRAKLLTGLIEAGSADLLAEDVAAFYRSRALAGAQAATAPLSFALEHASIAGAAAATIRPAMLGYLTARENAWTVEQTGPALLAVGPISAAEALTMVDRTFDGLRLSGDDILALRFWAIALSGGDFAVNLAARLLAVNSPPMGEVAAPAARVVLEAALQILEVPGLRGVARRTQFLMRSVLDYTKWTEADAAYLHKLLARLPAADAGLTEVRAAVERRLAAWAPAPRPWPQRVAGWLVPLLGVHFLLWLAALVTVYPRSRLVQSVMLFSPSGRAVTGLLYTQLLILLSPRLRKRLFHPLVGPERDAEVAAFDAASFHDQIRVAPLRPRKNPQAPVELEPAVTWTKLTALAGVIVIEGASGLGKTQVLRALLDRARAAGRTCLFVRASDCNGGVIKEIAERLALSHSDGFVELLLHRGSIELFIDGLNEAQPNGVAEIARFCERAVNARIVLTTQPMTWACPRRARQVRLLPLEPSEFEAFLLAQWPTVGTAEAGEPRYRARVTEFVASHREPREVAVLQNRNDLAFVAHLLAREVVPNIHSLRKQVVDDAARAYEASAPGGAFPLAALAQEAVRVLETGHPLLVIKELDPGVLGQLAERKLLLHRGNGDWLFRHDTITCYFAAQGFFAPLISAAGVEPGAMKKEHLASPRFVGVYLQLAESLPVPAAQRLAAAIRDHGRESGDRSLEIAFQDVLDRRAAG